MVRHQGILDIVMLQQDARRASIFRKHEIHLFQDPDSPEGHVLHIANRSWNNVQYAHNGDKFSVKYQNKQKKW